MGTSGDADLMSNGMLASDFLHTFQVVLDSHLVFAGCGADMDKEAPYDWRRMVNEDNLRALVQLHQLVSEHQLHSFEPSSKNLVSLCREVSAALKDDSLRGNKAANGIQTIIGRSTWKHLCLAFDDIANRYEPTLPDIPHEVDEDEGCAMKIVRLVRNHEPLGATIKCQSDGSVIIARVMKGGVADRSGVIQVGDTVIEVNGVLVAGLQPADIVKLLAFDDRTVTFKLVPCDSSDMSQSSATSEYHNRVRALFDYRPEEDRLHPCPEAGLTFNKGDILELVDSHDEHWWQARLELDCGITCNNRLEQNKVGLIPSRKLQERKRALRCSSQGTLNSSKSTSSSGRIRKVLFESNASQELDTDTNRNYEDVALLYPSPNVVRPLVLIGSSGVGRNELQRRLIMLNSDRFTTCVPHTSRTRKSGETDGVDYNFVSRSQMEVMVSHGKFIEYGEYRGNLYGTATSTIESVLSQGRTPILTPHPQAIRLLRNPKFKPFIVFVKPPPFTTLKETRAMSQARSTLTDNSYSRGFTDEELSAMISSSEQLQMSFGHCFDYQLTNANIDFAFRELCEVLHRLEIEPQWVPANWVFD